MIPHVFVALEQLPLMANGKVDRRGLPAPVAERKRRRRAGRRRRWKKWWRASGAELWVSGEWQDNFFELGGHSLLATQVISRLRDVSVRGAEFAGVCSSRRR